MGKQEEVLARVRAKRWALATVGPVHNRSDAGFELVAIPSADGDALRDLLLAARTRTVIEIGLAYGSSSLAIAEALLAGGSDDARHWIIDAYQKHFHYSGWDALVEVGLTDICSFIEERSQIVLPRLLCDGLVADAAFVDGSHTFPDVFVDLFYLRELVRPGGLVILDDAGALSVATAAKYFVANAGWKPEAMAEPTRLRAFRLPNPRIEPSMESFRPFGIEPRG